MTLPVILLAGCESQPKDTPPAIDRSKAALGDNPLYVRLGGEPGIAAVVDDLVALSADNPKVNFARKGTPRKWDATPENVERMKRSLTIFICQAAGGPHKYKGPDMKTVHQGMRITDAEFDALAADLKTVLVRHRIPQSEQDDLMAVVASTRGDIVE